MGTFYCFCQYNKSAERYHMAIWSNWNDKCKW